MSFSVCPLSGVLARRGHTLTDAFLTAGATPCPPLPPRVFPVVGWSHLDVSLGAAPGVTVVGPPQAELAVLSLLGRLPSVPRPCLPPRPGLPDADGGGPSVRRARAWRHVRA